MENQRIFKRKKLQFFNTIFNISSQAILNLYFDHLLIITLFAHNRKMQTHLYFFVPLWLAFASQVLGFSVWQENAPGMFFVGSAEAYVSNYNEKLLYYYDLNEYYDGVDTLKECLSDVEKWCYLIENIATNIQCSALLDILDTHMNKTESSKKSIKLFSNKPRSGNEKFSIRDPGLNKMNKIVWSDDVSANHLDYVTNEKVYNQKYADEFLPKFKTVRLNLPVSKTLHEELKFITQNRLADRESEEVFVEFFSTFLSYFRDFEYFAARIQSRSVQSSVFMDLISKDQFQTHVREISESNSNDLLFIPANDENYIAEIIARSNSVIFEDKVFLLAHVPFVEKIPQVLYRYFPVPFNVLGNSVLISMKYNYYLMNETNKTYIPLYGDTSKECTRLSSGEVICIPAQPQRTQTSPFNECEWPLFFGDDITRVLKECDFRKMDNHFARLLLENTKQKNCKLM